MRVYLFFCFGLTCLLSSYESSTRPLVTFFIQTYPTNTATLDHHKLYNTITSTGKLHNKILRKNILQTQTNDGIFSAYWGYLAVSDLNGQVSFPRFQQSNSFNLLITDRIQPIMMLGNTIHHWQLEANVDAKLYSFQFYQDPGHEDYWNIEEKILPSDKRISLDTIILFAKPKDIYIMIGKQPATENPNIVLPDVIYAKKSLNRIAPALWLLKMRQFFGPVIKNYKKEAPTYYSEQVR